MALRPLLHNPELVMQYDPILGKHFLTPQANAHSRQDLAQATAQRVRMKRDREIAYSRRMEAQAREWEGIEVRSSVLLSEKASQAISKRTMTASGQVRLDGLVVAIEDGRARVQIHWLTTCLKGTATELVTLGREEVEPLGHPFTWWALKDLRVSAIRRSVNHNRRDGWKQPIGHGFWEE